MGHSPATPSGAHPGPAAAHRTETRVPMWHLNHTPQTRLPPGERADKPASCSEFQICNPPPLQVKLWHDQKFLDLEEKELCSNPALPLSGCVTFRMLAASWSLSHVICFWFFFKTVNTQTGVQVVHCTKASARGVGGGQALPGLPDPVISFHSTVIITTRMVGGCIFS